MSAVVSAVTLCFALTVGLALHVPVGGMLLFSLWCASIALAAWRLPLVFYSGVEYLVTEKHVIWRRGRIKRIIDRTAVSYALIRWSAREPDVGDLVLVRAVPTGALRRTLKLTLSGVAGPDLLWAIVRGMEPSAPLGRGNRPLGQRLDSGERVLWSGIPLASPWTFRRIATAVVALPRVARRGARARAGDPSIGRVLRLHALPVGLTGLLIAGVALVLLLVAVAIGIGYVSLVRPVRLARKTLYVVTDRRVLIRRDREELTSTAGASRTSSPRPPGASATSLRPRRPAGARARAERSLRGVRPRGGGGIAPARLRPHRGRGDRGRHPRPATPGPAA